MEYFFTAYGSANGDLLNKEGVAAVHFGVDAAAKVFFDEIRF
ncbi:hypothetical protein PJO52_30155 [Mycobacterium kansasii]